MISPQDSHRRLRLERLEGRWLMAAGDINLLSAEPFRAHDLSGSESVQVDRQHQHGDRSEDHHQSRQHDQGRNRVNNDGVDQVMRQRDSHRDFHRSGEPIRNSQQRHDKTARDARQPTNDAPVAQTLVLQPSTITNPIATQTRTFSTPPAIAPSNPAPSTLAPPANATPRNPVLPTTLPTISRGSSLNSPQGEQPVVRAAGNDGENTITGEQEASSSQQDTEPADAAVALAQIANNADSVNDASETTFVSFQSRDTELFLLDGSSTNLLSQLSENAEQSFLEFADEAIRQSGLAQWLSESESVQLELAELDRLLDTLAESETRAAELDRDSRQMHRNLASTLHSIPGNGWAQSVGDMIPLLPGTETEPNLASNLSSQPTEASAPWSAGIGLFRAFDFAGANTELDQAIANVSVSVDADSWNLLTGAKKLERPASELPESFTLPISTSTTLGFAVTVLGAHYLHGRYRRILSSKHQSNTYITDVGASRTGGE